MSLTASPKTYPLEPIPPATGFPVSHKLPEGTQRPWSEYPLEPVKPAPRHAGLVPLSDPKE